MTSEPAGGAPVTGADVQHILITKTGADPQIFTDARGRSLADLGIDSLAVLELAAVVQDTYRLEFPEDALCMTIDQIVDHVNSQTARA
jgi:acyl carrier protein